MDYKKFELAVRNELWKRDINMNEFAKMLGITAPYLSDILKGKRDAQKQRERIIKILGIEVEK